jgi:hypothetical protein
MNLEVDYSQVTRLFSRYRNFSLEVRHRLTYTSSYVATRYNLKLVAPERSTLRISGRVYNLPRCRDNCMIVFPT